MGPPFTSHLLYRIGARGPLLSLLDNCLEGHFRGDLLDVYPAINVKRLFDLPCPSSSSVVYPIPCQCFTSHVDITSFFVADI